MSYSNYNSSLPAPITFATRGAFAPDATYLISATGQVVDIDVEPFSTAVVTISGSFTSSSSTPFDIGIFVSADGKIFLQRPVFSLLLQRARPGTVESGQALPDIYYIPVLGCRVLRFLSAPDFGGTISIGIHLTSGPATTDIPGSVVPKTRGDLALGNAFSNIPNLPSDIEGAQISQLCYPLIFNGTPSSLNWERPRTPIKWLPFVELAISEETPIWSPPIFLPFFWQIWRLMGYHLASSVAGNLILRDGTGGAVIAVIPCAGDGAGAPVDWRNGIASQFNGGGLFQPADNLLTIQGPPGALLSGTIWGQEGFVADVGPTIIGGGGS